MAISSSQKNSLEFSIFIDILSLSVAFAHHEKMQKQKCVLTNLKSYPILFYFRSFSDIVVQPGGSIWEQRKGEFEVEGDAKNFENQN